MKKQIMIAGICALALTTGSQVPYTNSAYAKNERKADKDSKGRMSKSEIKRIAQAIKFQKELKKQENDIKRVAEGLKFQQDNADKIVRPYKSKKLLGNFTLTAYTDNAICCGVAGQATASGVKPTANHTVAMGGIPFGTKLMINGKIYTVEDRGTSYGHVDIFFKTYEEAVNFGLQHGDVYQLEY